MELSRSEAMMMALLKSALHGENRCGETLMAEATEEDWTLCHRLATKHGVMAMAWDGMTMLPQGQQPPKAIKLKWALQVEAYGKRYEHYCKTVERLSGLFADKGITTVQLKGVGLSADYPIPAHREGGDIDIFTFSTDTTRMSHEEANRLADETARENGAVFDKDHSYKHSNYVFDRVPVENHRWLLNVKGYRSAAYLDALLRKVMTPRAVEIGCGHSVMVPSPEFNTIFLACHTAHHFGMGMTMHHIVDWACHTMRHGICLPEGMDTTMIATIIRALTRVCNEWLDTQVALPESMALTGERAELLADTMMQEVLHPQFTGSIPQLGRMGILAYKYRRFRHTTQLQAMALDTDPVYKKVWASVVAHIKVPRTIFG